MIEYLEILGRSFRSCPEVGSGSEVPPAQDRQARREPRPQDRKDLQREATPPLEGDRTSTGFMCSLTTSRVSDPIASALVEFHRRHLVHVSLGVESGDPGIRSRHGTTWDNSELRRFVSDARAAGIGMSLLTLVAQEDQGSPRPTLPAPQSSSSPSRWQRGEIVYLLDERELGRADVAGGERRLHRRSRRGPSSKTG